jgi:DNA-binding CsgD family transcriptional regulator
MNFNMLSNEKYLKAARIFYFVALFSFTISLLLNLPEYYINRRWGIILIDAITIIIVYSALVFYLKNIIGLKWNSFFLVYGTLINISLSTWYYYYHDIFFSNNFLFGTFIFCIYIVIAGFCIGHRQVFFVSALYVTLYYPLVFVSQESYLIDNAIVLPFLIIVFSFAVSAFLYLFEKSHKLELILKDELYLKDKVMAIERNQCLNTELENKKSELMAKTMFLLKHSENNNSFIRDLNEFKGRIKNSEQKLLNTIIQKHRFEQYNSHLKEFKDLFLEIHPHFYSKLYQACPLLSASEYKLAAMLHLGLSSKQIASITSVTPESVDVARSRLRKRLNLPSETKLATYLLAL